MPTPLVFVLAMCQGSLRLLPCRIDCLRGTFIASKCRRRLRTFSTAKRWMDLLVKLPHHSQFSTPRSVALEQLPSPGASSLEGVIWYTDLPEVSTSQRGLVHCGRHPNNSMPMTGVLMACTRGLGRPILVVALGFYSPRVMPGVSRVNSQHE
jgi:hypothetical protein